MDLPETKSKVRPKKKFARTGRGWPPAVGVARGWPARLDGTHGDEIAELRPGLHPTMKTVQDLDEMEAIRELLIALRKVQGFVPLSEELSRVNGRRNS